jgi:ABC-type lipoprotein release transport system permease subunit
MRVLKMGWRGVWRNRRRTLVTMAATSFGLLVMILYHGVMEGYLQSMERTVVDLEVGDVQIYARDYRENPSIYTRIENSDAVVDGLRAQGFPASPRLLGFGMAAAGDSSAGVSFRGIDVQRDAAVSRIHEQLARGEWLDPEDARGVVLGRRIARTLGVDVGGEILVLSQGADGSLAYDLYRVRGVLLGVSDAIDRTGLFMTQKAYRELFVVPEGVHQIVVRRPPGMSLGSTANRVQEAAGVLDVKTWRQLMPTVSTMLDSARSLIVFMFVIVYIAIGMLILNAMLMAVFERVREFGVLKALGVSPLDVLRLIFVESAIITGLAIAIGVGLSIPGLIYLRDVGIDLSSLAGVTIMGIAMDPVWRAVITPDAFRLPILTLVVIVVVAVVYPATKAALISPVEAMRHR